MSLNDKHYDLEIQDLIDGRLDPDVQSKVESHIATCSKCRSEFENLKNIKHILTTQIQQVATPADLRSKVHKSLEKEKLSNQGRRFGSILAAAAVMILLIIAAILYRNISGSNLPSIVAEDYQSFVAKRLTLQKVSNRPEEIQNFFRNAGIPFETRVFDLAMMNYQLLGGTIHEIDDKQSAFFVYEGPNQIKMVCQMFLSSVKELPYTSEIRDHNGIRFFIFKEEDVNLVFWQEGKIVCVLASDTNKEDVIQLAFAKAVKI
jgi:anti-sigma factor RsiW